MKNIIKILLSVLVFAAVWGCDLNKYRKDAVVLEESVRTMADVEKIRSGNYIYARRVFGGALSIPYELMGDYMNSAVGASNTNGSMPRWSFNSSASEVADVWNGAYGAISNINYFLDHIDEVEAVTDKDKAFVEVTKGEVTLLRAMLEHQLLLKFCKSYVQVDPSAEWGIPSMRTYNPGIKPGRNTLKESYDLLIDDIEYAKTALSGVVKAPENEGYLHIDCVYALEAQVRLAMGDWAGSALAAEEVIKKDYALAGTASALKTILTTDAGSEIIYNFYADNIEGGAEWGRLFRTDPQQNGSYYTADFIPTQGLIDLYDDNDIRKDAYFIQGVLGKDGPSGVWLFNKYPGNPLLRLQAGNNNYLQKRVVFRLADMYLTAAEAHAMSENTVAANERLGQLRSKRIPGYSHTTINDPVQLMEEIKAERRKEMVMEGTRISDLKRWNDDMVRLHAQYAGGDITIAETRDVVIAAGYYKFVWPIPFSETTANDVIKNQQNEGW